MMTQKWQIKPLTDISFDSAVLFNHIVIRIEYEMNRKDPVSRFVYL